LDLAESDSVSSRGKGLPTKISDVKTLSAEEPLKDRRKTMIGTIADQYASPKAEIKVTRQQPSYDHIILKKLTIKHVVKFISAVGEYQARNGVSLPLATMLDKDVRSYLIARSNDMFQGSDEAFFSLPAPEVLDLIRKAVKPTSSSIFRANLTELVSTELTPLMEVSTENFQKVYEALLLYRSDFIAHFNLMAQDNEVAVPLCSNKEGGLIEIFLKKLPTDYCKNIMFNFKKDGKKEWKDIHSFLEDFYIVVQSQYTFYEELKDFSHSLNPKVKLKTSQPKLIQEADTNNRKSDNEEHNHQVQPNETRKTSASNNPFDDDEDDDEVEEFLNAMDLKNSNTKSLLNAKADAGACLRMLLHGNCDRGDACKYSHDHQILENAYSIQKSLLINSKFNPAYKR
jgi:hypothetical protein